MAKAERKGFLLYHSIRKPLKKLTDAQIGRLLLAAFDYSENGVEPEFDNDKMDMAFAFMQIGIDEGIASWEAEREQRSKAGKASADARRKDKQKD